MIRILVALLLVVAAGPALAQRATAIGEVERVVVWSYGTAPGASVRDLHERQPVVVNDAVETVRDGALHLRFGDDTSLRLGSQSRAVLDRFVYDPAQGAGEMTVELGRGVFRFVSGRMDKRGYSLVTPTATIGVRGTDLVIEVLDNGDTIVTVVEGEAVVGPRDVGAGATVTRDEQGVARNGERQVQVQPRPPLGRAVPESLSNDAGRGDSGHGGGGGSFDRSGDEGHSEG